MEEDEPEEGGTRREGLRAPGGVGQGHAHEPSMRTLLARHHLTPRLAAATPTTAPETTDHVRVTHATLDGNPASRERSDESEDTVRSPSPMRSTPRASPDQLGPGMFMGHDVTASPEGGTPSGTPDARALPEGLEPWQRSPRPESEVFQPGTRPLTDSPESDRKISKRAPP